MPPTEEILIILEILRIKNVILSGNIGKLLYICTRKACEAAHARQNEQALLPSLNRSFVRQKQ